MKHSFLFSAITGLILSGLSMAQEALPKTEVVQDAAAKIETTQEEKTVPLTPEEIKERFKSAKFAGEIGDLSSYGKIKVLENQFFLGSKDTSTVMEARAIKLGNKVN